MTGTSASSGSGKAVMTTPVLGADGSVGSEKLAPSTEAAAASGSEDNVLEMMGRLWLTTTEAEAVVLDDGGEDILVHSPWTIVGKVLAPNIVHISTITSALRPAWGNPRGLLLNPAGDNRFVAEFATRADKERVVDSPPWVVGKHAVLLQDFNIDLKPQNMVFKGLKIWARIINLPFGYMHKRWGVVIASSLGIEGSKPVVDCDGTGRCWGSYMRVRVEDEHIGPSDQSEAQINAFRDCLQDYELMDIGFEGPKFTWSNRQEADTHVKVRLDRAVANGDFSRIFEDCAVENIITTSSHHYAILIALERDSMQIKEPPVQQNFIYEAMWLRAPDYKDVLESAWSAGAGATGSLQSTWHNISHVATSLRDWSRATFGSIRKKIRKLEGPLRYIRGQILSEGELKEEMQLSVNSVNSLNVKK
ncbi:hypothetical protein ACQ4PT_018963 [Festuca glaucescens]